MITQFIRLAACAGVLLLAGCEPDADARFIAAGARNGVNIQQVPLARLVPAVPAGDVEQGRCDASHRQPIGVGIVQMSFPAAEGEIATASVMLDADGGVMTYSELRQTAAGTTSVLINTMEGTGGATNVTDGGARVVIGRGTAEEALRSEVLGIPSRRIERMLARCGRPGETNGQS
jgi:hypothetical protein